MADQQSEPQVKKMTSWDVNLPGNDYVLQQWLVRNGSSVQQGDKLATAITKDSSGSTATTSATASSSNTAVVVKHKRPKKRKRVAADSTAATATTAAKDTAEQTQPTPATDAETATKPTTRVKKLSSHLPQTPNVITIVSPAAGILSIESKPILSSPLKIASIEPCQHPAIMGGLCAVCGASMGPQSPSKQSSSTFSATSPSSFQQNTSQQQQQQVTVSGGVTMTISETEAHEMSLETCQKLQSQRRLSLVLDLDHTLVHATADVRARTHYVSRNDVRTLILPIAVSPSETRWMQHYVKLRPHVEEFLRDSQEMYQISVYTAGTRTYAEHVCMLLARNMVGATKDEEDLQRMRHEVMCGEYEVASLNKKKSGSGDSGSKGGDLKVAAGDTAATANKMESSSLPAKEPVSNGHAKRDETASNGDNKKDGDPPTKKKRVSFGEPPEETKTDAMTPERLEQLKHELEEAEKLEQQALDVRQQVFGSRIVSRTDVGDLGRDVKSLERIFPGGGSMALIVDDREDVWANAEDSGEPPENLLLIRPYHWKPFAGFAEVNNSAGEDISGEATSTQDEDDVALLWTLDILKRVHTRFYAAVAEGPMDKRDVSVPPLLHEMRRQVLRKCTLLFSGVIPLSEQNRPDRRPPNVIRYARSLGARVLENVDNTITHCVAARDGTEKVRRARRVPGCVVVKVSWFMECYWTITRRDETPHLLGKAPVVPAQAAAAEATSAAGNESSSDDDDDLAAMLEADMME